MAKGSSTISYADVADFEVGIYGLASAGRGGSHPSVLPILVSSPIIVNLESDTMDEIFKTVEDFSTTAAIFHFRGFWPSLPDLHTCIYKHWEPIITDIVQIYPMERGFSIVKFQNAADRNIILCNSFFSWEERVPLMAKP